MKPPGPQGSQAGAASLWGGGVGRGGLGQVLLCRRLLSNGGRGDLAHYRARRRIKGSEGGDRGCRSPGNCLLGPWLVWATCGAGICSPCKGAGSSPDLSPMGLGVEKGGSLACLGTVSDTALFSIHSSLTRVCGLITLLRESQELRDPEERAGEEWAQRELSI